LEYWNDGMMEKWAMQYSNIPLFHHPILPATAACPNAIPASFGGTVV